MEGKKLHFPASGSGSNSYYYDDELLFSGDYQIISGTIHNSSRDLNNSDTKDLRKGLLFVKSLGNEGFYEPLNTADGYLNGSSPTQFMSDVVVLGIDASIDKIVISTDNRIRYVDDMDIVAPMYLTGSFLENVFIYNNMDEVAITNEQWGEVQRITIVPSHVAKFINKEAYVRSLLFRRIETFK
jgi:hypothetical protein